MQVCYCEGVQLGAVRIKRYTLHVTCIELLAIMPMCFDLNDYLNDYLGYTILSTLRFSPTSLLSVTLTQ